MISKEMQLIEDVARVVASRLVDASDTEDQVVANYLGENIVSDISRLVARFLEVKLGEEEAMVSFSKTCFDQALTGGVVAKNFIESMRDRKDKDSDWPQRGSLN